MAATCSGRAKELVKEGLMIAFERIRELFGRTAGVAKLSDVFQFQWTSSNSLEDESLRWLKLMRQVNMTSLGDEARETLTTAVQEKAQRNNLWKDTYVWTVLCASVDQYLRTTVDSSSQPTPMEIGAVMSTCACCGIAGHENARCRFCNAKCSICGKTGHLRAMCRQREKSAGKSSPSSSSGKSSGKSGTSRGNTDKCCCGGQVGHRRPECPRRNESCSLCGKRGHLSQVCRSYGGNASARAVEVELTEPEEEREIQHVWALSICDNSGIPLDILSVCDNSDLPFNESGNLLDMIMDSGAEEHVVSLADWRSLGEPLLKLAQVRLRSATGDDM